MGWRLCGCVLGAWSLVCGVLTCLCRDELASTPADTEVEIPKIENQKVGRASLIILGLMVVLFMRHRALHWETWFGCQ